MNVPAVGTPFEPESSPLRPGSLLELFFQPTRFFSGHIARGATPYVVFVTGVCGIASAMGRVDKQMMRAELASRVNPLEQMGALDSWVILWSFIAAFGLVSAALLWTIGGWWYRVRLRWSGATEPDPRTARVVFIYATFIQALPAVLIVIAATLLYTSYRAYWHSDELWSSLWIIFPFWSCVTSYKGARATFDVARWKARLWFLVLPLVVYTFGLGLLSFLYSLSGIA